MIFTFQNWSLYTLSEQTFISFTFSSPRRYWNFFSTPIVKGFRREFALLQNFAVSFYFLKASKFLFTSASLFRTKFLIFGVPTLSLASEKFTTNSYQLYFNLFIRLYNILVIGFKWQGGALSNFKRFWNYNNYYYTYKAHWKKFYYYPTVAFSSAYGYEMYSLGFESLSCYVPLISPVDSSIDLSPFGYPILASPTINNANFFSNYFFFKFFQGFLARFTNFKNRKKISNSKFMSQYNNFRPNRNNRVSRSSSRQRKNFL